MRLKGVSEMAGKIIIVLVLATTITMITIGVGIKGNDNDVIVGSLLNLALLMGSIVVLGSIFQDFYQGRPIPLSQLPQDGIYFLLNNSLPSDSWHKNEFMAVVKEERQGKVWLVVSNFSLPGHFYLKDGKPMSFVVEPQAQPEQPA